METITDCEGEEVRRAKIVLAALQLCVAITVLVMGFYLMMDSVRTYSRVAAQARAIDGKACKQSVAAHSESADVHRETIVRYESAKARYQRDPSPLNMKLRDEARDSTFVAYQKTFERFHEVMQRCSATLDSGPSQL